MNNMQLHSDAPPSHADSLRCSFIATNCQGLTRFATSGDKGDLPLIDFKLHQLLELHVTIGLPECSSTYSECVRELSSVIQNLYMNAHSCIEGFFENLASHNNDTELGQCMDMVCNLLELGDICARHAQTTDCVHQVGDPKLIDITKNITGLFERMMQESGNAAMNYIKIVQHDEHLRKTLQPDCDSLPSANQLAVSRLDKMRSLAQLLNRGVYDCSISEISPHIRPLD